MAEELKELEGRNWVATLMLCWSFGSFGAHRFYTGKTTTAWVMFAMTLSCFLAPISAIWAFIDGILIALGNWKTEKDEELYERIPWIGYAYIVIMCLVFLCVIFQILLVLGIVAGAMSNMPASMPPSSF